jgi:hypothetical protein
MELMKQGTTVSKLTMNDLKDYNTNYKANGAAISV